MKNFLSVIESDIKGLFAAPPTHVSLPQAVVSASTAAALKGLGTSVSTQAVALLAQSEIGEAVDTMVSDAKATGVNPIEKAGEIAVTATGLIVDYAKKGGLPAVEADAASLAIALVHTAINDIEGADFASGLLKLFHI